MYFKRRIYSYFLFLAGSLLIGSSLLSCSREDTSLGRAEFPPDYEQQFESWHEQRLYDLTHPTGWMRLAGLFWLSDGKQTFGKGSGVTFQFPDLEEGIWGEFSVRNDSVFITSSRSDEILIDSMPLQSGVETLIYSNKQVHSESTESPSLSTAEEYAPVLNLRDLEWFIIKRGDLLGVRLYNKQNPVVDAFDGFDRFPIDSSWIVRARLLPYSEPRKLRVMNILGQMDEVDSPGILEFQIGKEIYTLTPMTEGDQLFIVFADSTNQESTYESGRYLYVDPPIEGSIMTFIDFNKAYNPPCSYSSYSTCQIPPPENRLPIHVTAGEKRPTN